MITFDFKDNSKEAIAYKNAAIEAALEAIGLEAEKHATEYISGEKGHIRRVDTGRLRGSIEHKVVPDEEAVYVGTNVEYALPVHDGTNRMQPNRFLKDAAADYVDDYKKIVLDALKG